MRGLLARQACDTAFLLRAIAGLLPLLALPLPVAADPGNAAVTTGPSSISEQSLGAPYCSTLHCASPNSTSIPQQFVLMAACLNGPDASYGSACGCADVDIDGRVSLRDFALFQNLPLYLCKRTLAIRLEPALGFCPEVGAVYEAIVVPALNGGALLTGNLVEWRDPQPAFCHPPLYDYFCFIGLPLAARELSADEALDLRGLLQAIPAQCDTGCDANTQGTYCCWIYDPCVIIGLTYSGGSRSDYCYGCGNSNQMRHAIQSVFDYVTFLATGG